VGRMPRKTNTPPKNRRKEAPLLQETLQRSSTPTTKTIKYRKLRETRNYLIVQVLVPKENKVALDAWNLVLAVNN